MPDSVKTTRVCLLVGAGLEIGTGLLFLFIFAAGAVLVGWGTERSGLLGNPLLGPAGVLLFVLYAALGVAGVFTAAGVAKGRPGSRLAAAGLCLVMVAALPVAGLLLSLFALKGLTGPEARAWFGSPDGVPPVSLAPPSAP